MCLRPWVRILHSAEEDNLSPFDSNIACLCQSIEINNNKYVYRQSQVRKPTGSEVEWAECLLIIGTGSRVQFLAWSSIAQSVFQQACSLLANRCLRPWIRILHSAEEDNLSPFDSNIACLCQSIEINKQQICISPEPGAKVNCQWGWVGWMLADHRDGLSSSFYSLILDSSVGLSEGIQSAGE